MNHTKSPYTKFILMCLASAISMYITMYFHTYEFSHVYFSWTRLYMTLIGVSGMALIMFFFMKKMYTNSLKNSAIIISSMMLMLISTILVRSQTPIEDVKWMKAMIPHHSIAVLTSSQANLEDPEVKKLAEDIIQTQEKEIAQMKEMIQRLENEEQ